MFQTKLAARLTLPLALLCSVAVAQDQQPANCVIKTPEQPKPQIQASVLANDETYGSFVAYKGPPLKPTPAPAAESAQPACTTNDQAANNSSSQQASLKTPPKDEAYGSYVPYKGPPLKATPPPAEVATPANCMTNPQPASSSSPQPASAEIKPQPQPQPIASSRKADPPQPVVATDDPLAACTMVASLVYGPYVPYTGPPVRACGTSVKTAPAAATQLAEAAAPPEPRLAPPTANEIALAAPTPISAPSPEAPLPSAPSPGDPAGGSGYIRVVPPPIPEKQPLQIRPFRSVAVGFKADTLGAGVELATPLSRSFNLRSSFNIMPFNYPFSIDGLNYSARFHLQSNETVVDWFPLHGSFHVSSGVLYAKNSLSATTYVNPGQSFTLGKQPFINSVDDPTNGSATVVYPHSIAPMLLLGFGNIIPRSGSHLSFPVEFGAAYTGAPTINVSLTGTACTTTGCANFATNTQAQSFLNQEVHDLNEDLKKFPFYPIFSIGVAYHFYTNPHHGPAN